MTKQTWDREKFKFSGEFKSAPLEQAYLQLSWPDIKTVTRYALLAMAFMGSAFFISDLLNVKDGRQLYLLLAIRLTAGSLIVLSAEYIYRSKHYFKSYPYLLAFNQVVVAVGLCGLAVLRQMPPAYLGVNTILCTLFYYQFINNRFAVTVAASIFFGLSSMTVCVVYLAFIPSEIVGAVLFLVPLNLLGIVILRLMNLAKRREYLALNETIQHNQGKEKAIAQLKAALAEVKTLRGFLPICTKCHKVRDDHGYWEKIENYIQDRTEAQFNQSLCPECEKGIYTRFLKDVPK